MHTTDKLRVSICVHIDNNYSLLSTLDNSNKYYLRIKEWCLSGEETKPASLVFSRFYSRFLPVLFTCWYFHSTDELTCLSIDWIWYQQPRFIGEAGVRCLWSSSSKTKVLYCVISDEDFWLQYIVVDFLVQVATHLFKWILEAEM